ncbi:MAG: aminomethyltransferase family protein [Alphaproteobacteria bacterium]
MTGAAYANMALKTPFHSRLAPLCHSNAWQRWAGYATVGYFTSVEDEYFAVRNAATLFDISPMVKYRIAGADAARYMNRLIPRDVDKVAPGRVAYAVWCNDDGKVLDDGTVFRLDDGAFQLNSQERHLCWLLDSALGFDVSIEDVSDAVAGLALQGPTSCAVLKAAGIGGVETLKPYRFTRFELDGLALMVSRTGYTGDLGYELWIDPGDAETLWDRLMDAGEAHGLRPIGSGALDIARIEAGFIQANTDFVAADAALRPSRWRSPFELGLDWMVDFDKGHFIGRRALLREKEAGSRYRVVGLDVEGNKPAAQALVYHGRKRREVGAVTSAVWSPTCKRNLAIATLKAAYADDDGRLWADVYLNKELKWERIRASCRVVARPFFNPRRRWATPAGDA